MKYYIIAGEASGDLHGSNLIKQIHLLDTKASIHCWGGDLMEAAGATLIKHYKGLAFMGFIEVIGNLRTIFKNLSFCKKDILAFQPDVLVLIDYPGFNLRIAKWAKQQGIKVVYYISPQVWAWKENRVPEMKKNIDKMLVILPFEKDYYATRWNWDVEYVGHPLIEVISPPDASKDDGPVPYSWGGGTVVLMPGSRKQEILKKLPIMLEVSKRFDAYEFVVAKAPGQDDEFYDTLLHDYKNVSSARNATYNLLQHADAALVTSGTATLETALFKVPEVVCYKGSPISYQIAKRLIKVKYISLVNLIMDKLVVKELIQNELNVENLISELAALLNDGAKRENLLKDYDALREKLTAGGFASANAAKIIIDFIS